MSTWNPSLRKMRDAIGEELPWEKVRELARAIPEITHTDIQRWKGGGNIGTKKRRILEHYLRSRGFSKEVIGDIFLLTDNENTED